MCMVNRMQCTDRAKFMKHSVICCRKFSVIIFATCSRAVSWHMGIALFCLGWLSLAVLYWVVSGFVAGLLLRKYYPYNQKTRTYHCSRQLFIQGHGSENWSIPFSWTCIMYDFEDSPHGPTFTWWGCCRLCFWQKPTELAHSFLFCSCVCFCLYGLFECISFHKFCWQLSAFSLCSSGHISALVAPLTINLFRKVSFGPDIVLCGWLGLKHLLIN